MTCTGVWTFMPLKAKSSDEVRGYALIDRDNLEELSSRSWYRMPKGYVVRSTSKGGKYRKVLMHRQVMGLEYGDSRQVDHINHDTLDNRKCNLRLTDFRTNGQNRAYGYGASRFRGVRFIAKENRWRARVTVNRIPYELGGYATEEEAGQVAAAFRKKHMPYSQMDQED